MRASPNWTVFVSNINRAFPQLNKQTELLIDV